MIALAKDINDGKDACPICLGKEFEKKTIPDTTLIKCTYCKRESTIADVLKLWISVPFFNVFDLTYYDGCRGWD